MAKLRYSKVCDECFVTLWQIAAQNKVGDPASWSTVDFFLFGFQDLCKLQIHLQNPLPFWEVSKF